MSSCLSWASISTRSSYLCATMPHGPSERSPYRWVQRCSHLWPWFSITLWRSSTDLILPKPCWRTQ
ncbi:hypothetical protein M9458_006965, partial [Cirrhinus mrigala]